MDNTILQAARFAALAHTGQKRKYSNLPYIIHPARVAGRVAILLGCTEEMVCAAYLHDVLEDTERTSEDIERHFGKVVADLVLELTSRSKQISSEGNREARKKIDHDYLATVSVEAKKIKMLDRIDNLREMDTSSGFAEKYATESEHLLATIGDADPDLKAELEYAIRALRAEIELSYKARFGH